MTGEPTLFDLAEFEREAVAATPWDGAPLTFGHYAVRTTPAPGLPAGTLLIDYGSPRNPALDPTRRLRDPLVALEPGDPTRLLGWTYVDAFGARIPTPSYFLLERWAELDHDA